MKQQTEPPAGPEQQQQDIKQASPGKNAIFYGVHAREAIGGSGKDSRAHTHTMKSVNKWRNTDERK